MTRNMEVNTDLNQLISQLNDDELEQLAIVCLHGYLNWRDPVFDGSTIRKSQMA